MNEPLDREEYLIAGLCMIVIILTVYAAIDMWADKRDQDYIRDLQRRVGQLEVNHK